MSDKPRLDTTRLQKIAQAYWESAALMAAVELDLFTAIAHGHDTIPALAKAIMACIEPDRDRRPPSCEDFLARIAKVTID